MNCNDCRERLFEWSEGLLDETLRSEVERHLEACPKCLAEANSLADLKSRIERDTGSLSGQSFAPLVLEEIARRHARRPETYRGRNMLLEYKGRLGLAAAAAAALVIAAVFILWDRGGTGAFALEQSLEAAQKVKTLHVVEQVPIESLRKEIPSNGPPYDPAVRAWANFKDAGKPMVTRREAWAEFDEKGRPLRYRYEFPVTEDGYKVVFWDPHKIRVWFKDKNGLLITSNDDFRGVPSPGDFDPKIALKDLEDAVSAGKATMTPESSVSADTLRYKVIPGDRPNRYRIYVVDAASKLLKSIEYYKLSDGKWEYIGPCLFMDYNKAVDESVWEITVPYDIHINDEYDRVIRGLARSGMTNEEVCREIVRQFYQALIDKDYAKAGSLLEGGESLYEMKQAYADYKYLRIVSIGDPFLTPENGPNAYGVPCKVEVESSGQREIEDLKAVRVRPVDRDSERWNIHGGV